jgi:hypothetical protein
MQKFTRLTLLVFSLLALPLLTMAQCPDCGVGGDGVFHPSTDTTLTGGVYEFSEFVIEAGIVVNVTGPDSLVIRCNTPVRIAGSLRANGGAGGDGVTFVSGGTGGQGVAGGKNGGDGVFSSPSGPLPGNPGSGGGAGGAGSGWSGGGGAGHAYAGSGSSGAGGLGGGPMGSASLEPVAYGGAGGGGGSGGLDCGSGGGGGGGGIIMIFSCDTIHVMSGGTLEAKGGNGGSDGGGNCGGGGGGSGGTIRLFAPEIVNDGMINLLWGFGGASAVAGPPLFGSGANAAPGRLRMDYAHFGGTGSILPPTAYEQVLPSVNVTGTSSVACFGDTTASADGLVSGGLAPFTYQWMPSGQTSATATGLGAGEHVLLITDSLGCTDTDTFVVTEPPALTLSTSATDESAAGAADGTAIAVVGGGTAPYTYVWNTVPPQTNDTATGLSAGTYLVLVTDSNGCNVTDSAVVSVVVGVSASLEAGANLSCFPNPANTHLQVKVLLPAGQRGELRMLNLHGQEIAAWPDLGSGGVIADQAVAHLPEGVYFLRLETEESVLVERVVIVH